MELRKSGLDPEDRAVLGQTPLKSWALHVTPQDQPSPWAQPLLSSALAVPFVPLGAAHGVKPEPRGGRLLSPLCSGCRFCSDR